MRSTTLVIMFSIGFSINSYSQKDTTKEVEPRYFYVAGNMNTYVNTIGAFNNRVSFSSEVGITFGIFDLGVAGGKLNSFKNDSSWFIELRPTINIFSKGRFSESHRLDCQRSRSDTARPLHQTRLVASSKRQGL